MSRVLLLPARKFHFASGIILFPTFVCDHDHAKMILVSTFKFPAMLRGYTMVIYISHNALSHFHFILHPYIYIYTLLDWVESLY